MKKLLFLLCASQLSFAQQALFTQPQKDQYNMFNAISTSVGSKGIYVADDFEFSKASTINKIKVYGRIDDGFLSNQNIYFWQLYIYKDNGGKPSELPYGRVYGFAKMPVEGGTTVTTSATDPRNITIEFDTSDSTFVFEANTKYWLTVYPTVRKQDNFFAQKNFYWAASTSNMPKLEEAKIKDTDNYLGEGLTGWTNISGPVMGVSGMAFELYGKDALGTSDVNKAAVKVYPNPTSKTISVAAKNVKTVEVYSLDGKLVLTSNKSDVNVETLVKGTYTLVVTFDNGQKSTEKFIKN